MTRERDELQANLTDEFLRRASHVARDIISTVIVRLHNGGDDPATTFGGA